MRINRAVQLLQLSTLTSGLLACTAYLDEREQGAALDNQQDDGENGDDDGGDATNPLSPGFDSVGTGGSSSLATGGHGQTIGAASGGSESSSAGGSSTNQPASGGAGSAVDTGPACKRGISFDRWVNPPSNADLDVLSPSVHWFYNWQYTQNPEIAGGYLGRGFEWVPMLRDGGVDFSDANGAITADAEFLLGFNEPNVRGHGGVDMTVEQVVNAWPQVEAIADAHDLTLVSPAVTFTNIPGERNGPEWLDRFFELCPNCRVDAIAMHTYTCEARWVADHLEPYRRFGLPIWVTEFACISQDANLVRKFMEDSVNLLENDPDVARYAWFMSRSGNLSVLDEPGQLTPLGELYVDLPEAKPCND